MKFGWSVHLLLSGAVWAPVLASGVEVETASQRVLFADADKGFGIAGIVNRMEGNARFVRGQSSAVTGTFWAVEFRRPCATGGVESVWISNLDACEKKTVEKAGGGCRFSWKGIALPGERNLTDVHADVCPNGEGNVEWRLSVFSRGSVWTQGLVRYPIFAGVVEDNAADVMIPGEWLGAKLYRKFNYRRDLVHYVRKGYRYTKACPSGWGPMLSAYMIGNAGLLVAAMDPKMANKEFWFVRDSTYFESPVENAGVRGLAAPGPSFTVTTTCYRGDWWKVAHIYRDWARRQKWTAKGPIALRRDYPRALADADIWIRVIASGYRTLDDAMRTWPGLSYGVRHYSWNVERFDTHYPEFQLRSGSETFWKEAARKGVVVTPYTNGRLWDMGMRSFRYARRDVCQRENGEPFTEKYASMTGVMCPFAKDWQATLLDMGAELVDRQGANGVYYDQIGCSRWYGCRNPAHGHPLEGGSWWTDGYRQALAAIKARFAPLGVAMTTEGPGEMFMDVNDGALIVGTNRWTEDVPFMTAVYSGYTTFYCIEQDPTDAPEAMFARQIQGVLFGCATGSWGQKELLSANSAERTLKTQSDVIYRAARLRKAARKYLAYGFLEDEIRLLDPVETIHFDHKRTRPWSSPGSDYPAILGTVWTDVTRTAGATFAANASSKSRTVRFRIPGRNPILRTIPGEKAPSMSVRDGVVELSLDPRQIAFVEYGLVSRTR